MSLNFIDLFSGIGGFHQALKKYDKKSKCVLACDIDKNCQEVYFDNYNIKPESNITELDETTLPDFDILCAGFPCQSFSNAGNKGKFNDGRGKLLYEIIRIAKHKKPKFMFLENVKHIKKIDNGNVFSKILSEINKIGYYVKDEETIFELSPYQLGIPQNRERVIFVCIRNDIYDSTKKIELSLPTNPKINFTKIFEKKKDTLKYKISDEVENVLNAWNEIIQVIDTGDKLSPTILCNEFKKKYTKTEFSKLPKWKQDYITKNKPIYEKYKSKWDTWSKKYENLLSKREIYCKLEWQVGPKKDNDSIWNYFIQLRQSGLRIKKTDYFPTLVALGQIPIYGKQKRYITPRECARLQSFPNSFKIHNSDKVAYKQFGNAVNVDVIHTVIKATLDVYLN